MTGLVCFGLFVMACGLALLWLAARYARERRGMGEWPATTGRVTGREVTELHRVSEKHPQRWRAEIVYEYDVGERAYRGDKISPRDPHFHSTVAAWNELRSFGDEVRVYYDPRRPERAFLRRRPLWTVIGTLILGIGLVATGLILGIQGTR